jgi:predicted O-methyltransferase YrrM
MIPNNPIVADLYRDGAALIPKAFEGQTLADLQSFCRGQVDNYKPFAHHLDSPAAPVYPQFYKSAIERGAQLLNELGFNDVRFHSGALIPKWLEEGRRGWHVDGWYWENSDEAWNEKPAQVGLLCYLDDAHRDTGALIIVPGSHRREVLGHYDFWETRAEHPEEKVLEANAGDSVILDPRCMHGVTGNTRTPNRLCLTLWFMLDFAKLDPRVQATVMLSVQPTFKDHIGSLAPDYSAGAAYFPHVKKPQFPIGYQRISALRQSLTDAEILGSAKQSGDDFVDTQETYTWYRALSAAKAPKSILELGVRYGYAAIAMLQGANWAGIKEPLYVGVDCQFDGINSNEIALKSINEHTKSKAVILSVDTRNTAGANAAINGYGTFDIVHVDADHSISGIANELEIAQMWVKPTGLIVIDDCDVDHVRNAALALCDQFGVLPLELPTFHRTIVVDVKKRTKYNY